MYNKLKNWILSNKLLSLLIGVILVLGIVLYFTRVKLHKTQSKLQYITYKDSTEVSLSKHGDTIYTVYPQPIDLVPKVTKEKYDSLLKEYNIKKSKVLTLTQIQTVYKRDTITAPPTIDTVYSGSRYYSYDKPDLSFKATADKNLTITNLKIPNTVSIITHKQDNLLKISVSNSNKNIQTEKVTSLNYELPKKTNRLQLSLQGGYGMTNKGLSPYLGIGFSYNISNFKHK